LLLLPRPAKDIAAGPIDEQAVEHGLHAGKLRGHPLPQVGAVAELLRLDPPHGLLRLADQFVELLARPDVEVPESLEELAQVLDRRIAKYFGLAVLIAAEPFGQVRDELGQLLGERLLRQADGLVEAGSRSARSFAQAYAVSLNGEAVILVMGRFLFEAGGA
jgi:hypothetical protein